MTVRETEQRKPIHLAAHFRVNNTTVWSDPQVGQSDRVRVVRAPRPHRRARPARLLAAFLTAGGFLLRAFIGRTPVDHMLRRGGTVPQHPARSRGVRPARFCPWRR